MRAGVLFVVLSVAMVACSPNAGTPSNNGLDKSDQGVSNLGLAPAFVVPTADGGTFNLDEHIANDGRPVFLNLWASWCFPCREEMPAIDLAAAANPDVAFIGVSVQDTTAEAQAFLDQVQVSYTIGFDEGGTVDSEYRPLGLPASYIISSEGVILERIFGKVTPDLLAEKFATHFG